MIDTFFKYTSATTALTVLTGCRLRWSSPVLFNDPFDVTQTLRLDFDSHTLQPLLVEAMADALAMPSPPPGSSPALKQVHSAIWESKNHKQRRAFLKDLRKDPYGPTPGGIASFNQLQAAWRDLVPSMRVLCLSDRRDITPMWNHYAGNYTGVVFEFFADPVVDSALQLAEPVQYQDAPPRIASPREWAKVIIETNGNGFHELFREMQYIKTMPWAYEREWRVMSYDFHSTAHFSDRLFAPEELRSVSLGPKISETDAAAIEAAARKLFPHATIFRTELPLGSQTAFSFHALP